MFIRGSNSLDSFSCILKYEELGTRVFIRTKHLIYHNHRDTRVLSLAYSSIWRGMNFCQLVLKWIFRKYSWKYSAIIQQVLREYSGGITQDWIHKQYQGLRFCEMFLQGILEYGTRVWELTTRVMSSIELLYNASARDTRVLKMAYSSMSYQLTKIISAILFRLDCLFN